MPRTLYLMVGHVGAGKTTFARRLAAERPALRFTPDEWMIPLFGVNDVDGKRDVVEGRLIWAAIEALRLGIDVVLDFGLWSREERACLHWLAATVGATAQTIYLPVDPETQLDQVRKRWAETPDESWDLSADDLSGWRTYLQEPDDDELAGRITVQLPKPHQDWGTWAEHRWPTSRRTPQPDE